MRETKIKKEMCCSKKPVRYRLHSINIFECIICFNQYFQQIYPLGSIEFPLCPGGQNKLFAWNFFQGTFQHSIPTPFHKSPGDTVRGFTVLDSQKIRNSHENLAFKPGYLSQKRVDGELKPNLLIKINKYSKGRIPLYLSLVFLIW